MNRKPYILLLLAILHYVTGNPYIQNEKFINSALLKLLMV